MECEKVWRRYETQIPKEKVKQIFMSCYLCGANDHFGDDCPVSGRAAYRHTAFSEDILTTFADEEEKVGLGNNSNPSPPPPRSPKKDQKTNSPSKSKKTKSPQQQVQLSSPSSRKDQGADNKSGKSNKRRYESEKDDADDKYFRNSYDDYESSFTGGNNGKRRHSDYSGSSYKSNNNSYQYHQSGGSSKSGSKQHQRDSYSPYNSHSKSNNGYGSPSKTGYGQASKSTAPRHKRR